MVWKIGSIHSFVVLRSYDREANEDTLTLTLIIRKTLITQPSLSHVCPGVATRPLQVPRIPGIDNGAA